MAKDPKTRQAYPWEQGVIAFCKSIKSLQARHHYFIKEKGVIPMSLQKKYSSLLS